MDASVFEELTEGDDLFFAPADGAARGAAAVPACAGSSVEEAQTKGGDGAGPELIRQQKARIDDLEATVARLRAELAAATASSTKSTHHTRHTHTTEQKRTHQLSDEWSVGVHIIVPVGHAHQNHKMNTRKTGADSQCTARPRQGTRCSTWRRLECKRSLNNLSRHIIENKQQQHQGPARCHSVGRKRPSTAANICSRQLSSKRWVVC